MYVQNDRFAIPDFLHDTLAITQGFFSSGYSIPDFQTILYQTH